MLERFFFLIGCTLLCSVPAKTHAQEYKLKHSYKIKPCQECGFNFEMSGLALFEDYVLILPQHENAIYYAKKSELLSQSVNSSPIKKIPFKFKNNVVQNDGWEALTIRKSSSNSMFMYLALEKCGGQHSCIYYSKLASSKQENVPFQINPVKKFGKDNPGLQNLSYEAITWIDYPEQDLSGLLLLPEKNSHEKLHPIFIRKNGEYIKVTSSSGMEYLRISDMAPVTSMSNKSYIAVSFCWKGANKKFTHADDWCFTKNDSWESKLELLTLNIEPKDGGIHVDVLNKKKLHQSFVKVAGPDKSRSYEYNAEGIAILPNGNIMLVNDNYPDGSNTEIRILKLDMN